jgi:mannose-1-phosphate guanylyltransferase
LRPLTETIPKPLIPLVDRPFLYHVLDHVARHGVDEVRLSSSYLEETFSPALAGRAGRLTVTWIPEPMPLGTGGAVANAALGLDETFLVLNGDILTDLDLTAMVARHRETRATATIALTPVQDARPFGLVAMDDDGAVREFREKPEQEVPGLINAGTYVLEPSVLDLVEPGVQTSVERDVFPRLVGDGLFARVAPGRWVDIGTPATYLRANLEQMPPGGLIDPSASIDPSATVVDSVVGPGSVVAERAAVERSVLLPGARVGPGARLTERIVWAEEEPVW